MVPPNSSAQSYPSKNLEIQEVNQKIYQKDYNQMNGNKIDHNKGDNKKKDGIGSLRLSLRKPIQFSVSLNLRANATKKKKVKKGKRKGKNRNNKDSGIGRTSNNSYKQSRNNSYYHKVDQLKWLCSDLGKDLPYLQMEEQFKKSSFFEEFVETFKGLCEPEKLCLSCFAMFPENAVVKKRLLVHWWVGERSLDSLNTDGKTSVEEIASKILQDFVVKRLIYPIDKKRRKVTNSFKMQPLIRSAVITLAQDYSFFNYISEINPTVNFPRCKRACLVNATEGSTLLNPEQNSNTNQEKLETLFNVSYQFPDFTVEQFSKMRQIKVLYLGRWQSSAENSHIEVENSEFLKGLKYMKDLRLFSLQGISGIREIPSSIKKLKNLRILDLKACYNLEKLPKEVGALKKLSHLDISGCYLIDHMPKELSSLAELQVLKGFVLGDPRRGNFCTLEDLAKLEKLRKLIINVNSEIFLIEEFSTTLFKFKELLKLKIAWGGGASPAKLGKNSKQERAKSMSRSLDKEVNTKKQESFATKSKPKNVGNEEDNNKEESGEEKAVATNQLERRRGSYKKQESGTGNSMITKQEKSRYGEEQDRLAAKQNLDKGGDSRNQKRVAQGLLFPVRRIRSFSRTPSRSESRLQKLDFQCFPDETLPSWLNPQNLKKLKKLYIRGGRLNSLGNMGNGPWTQVEVLRLKYLHELKLNWRELQTSFPNLQYLEKFKCPKVTFFPCDGKGVWVRSEQKNQIHCET